MANLSKEKKYFIATFITAFAGAVLYMAALIPFFLMDNSAAQFVYGLLWAVTGMGIMLYGITFHNWG